MKIRWGKIEKDEPDDFKKYNGQTRGGQTGLTAPGLTDGCFKIRKKIKSIKLR